MIRQLRKRHFYTFLLLWPLLIIIFISSLYFRYPSPSITKFPKIIQTQRLPSFKNALLISKKNIKIDRQMHFTLRFWKVREKYWLSIHEKKKKNEFLDKPDIVLYWQNTKDQGLSNNAYLLGTFIDEHEAWFALPTQKALKEGVYILYSLGHSEIVGKFNRQGSIE